MAIRKIKCTFLWTVYVFIYFRLANDQDINNDQFFDDHEMWDKDLHSVGTPTIRITEKHLKPLFTPTTIHTTETPLYGNVVHEPLDCYKNNLNLNSFNSNEAPIPPVIQNLFYKTTDKNKNSNKSILSYNDLGIF